MHPRFLEAAAQQLQRRRPLIAIKLAGELEDEPILGPPPAAVVEAETIALQPLGVRDGVGEHKTVLAHQHAPLGSRAHQRERLPLQRPMVFRALGKCSHDGRVAVRVGRDRLPQRRIHREIDLDRVAMVHALALVNGVEKLDPFVIFIADVAEHEPLAIGERLHPAAVNVDGVAVPHDRPVFYVDDVVGGCVPIAASAGFAAERARLADAAPAEVEGA